MDLTIVKSGYSIKEANESREIYEIELEFVGGNNISFDNFLKSFSNLYILLLDNASYC